MSLSINISQKAHDIASAVFRVAALVKHSKLKLELENAAILLVSEANLQAVDKLGDLVRLTETVGEMGHVNSFVLQRELNNLDSAIAESIAESIGNDEDVDLEKMFSEDDSATVGNRDDREEVGISKENMQFGNRHSAIAEFIRQLPNGCRMRDLMTHFPQVSERTLRNDLQALTDQNLIKKVGSQGPASYFIAVTPRLDALIKQESLNAS